LEKFTLTGVGRLLGVSVQAIYRHVQSREELVYLTAQFLSERFPVPPDDGEDWSKWAYEYACATRNIYEHAPGFASALMGMSFASSPRIPSRWEMAQRVAERSGFNPVMALWVNIAVHEFVLAWVARHERSPAQQASNSGHFKRGEDEFSEEEAPMFKKALAASDGTSDEIRFETTLRAIVEGLSRLREQA
jgi:AcrR family transcriptional regulator